MKPPSFKDSLLGHPLLVLPIMAAGGLALYGCYLDHSRWPVGLIALYVMNISITANATRMKFLAWKSAWDAMGDAPASAGHGLGGKLFVIMVLGSMMTYMAAHSDVASYRLGLALMVAVGLIGGTILLFKRRKGQQSSSPAGPMAPVSICVNTPILPVPSLAQAFAALPEHCLALR
jgi:hypothetical protein